jgi:hypothetical protein
MPEAYTDSVIFSVVGRVFSVLLLQANGDTDTPIALKNRATFTAFFILLFENQSIAFFLLKIGV